MSNFMGAFTEPVSMRGRRLLKLAIVLIPLVLLLAVSLFGHALINAFETTVGMLALRAFYRLRFITTLSFVVRSRHNYFTRFA